MAQNLRVQHGGEGQPTLLLLHGLGATSDVWNGWHSVLAERWPGQWIAPDLPGHGGSNSLRRYSFGSIASAVADRLEPDFPIVVLGHSLGGVIGLTLASGWFGIRVDAAIALGVKVTWSNDELARAHSIAQRPITWYDSRDEAAARYLRVSGLGDMQPIPDDAVTAGLIETNGQWRLAQDPRTFAVGAPEIPRLLAAAHGSLNLARGQHDHMVSQETLSQLHPSATTLPGLSHNAHVQDPAAVARLLEAPLTT